MSLSLPLRHLIVGHLDLEGMRQVVTLNPIDPTTHGTRGSSSRGPMKNDSLQLRRHRLSEETAQSIGPTGLQV